MLIKKSNCFLNKELNFSKENHVNSEYTCSFKKKLFSNLTGVLIYSLTKRLCEDCFKSNCYENFIWNVCIKISMAEFTVKEVTISGIFNISSCTNLGCQI